MIALLDLLTQVLEILDNCYLPFFEMSLYELFRNLIIIFILVRVVFSNFFGVTINSISSTVGFNLAKKDYIKRPKPNGYRSLHIVVAVPIFLENEKRMMTLEIQFRTIAMDFWASLEHQLCYKKENNCSKAVAEELLQCAELSAQLDLRMDRLRKSVLEQG